MLLGLRRSAFGRVAQSAVSSCLSLECLLHERLGNKLGVSLSLPLVDQLKQFAARLGDETFGTSARVPARAFPEGLEVLKACADSLFFSLFSVISSLRQKRWLVDAVGETHSSF